MSVILGVQQALVHSHLEEWVNAEVPADRGNESEHTLKLSKSLHGLEQAATTLNAQVVNDLNDCSFETCLPNTCLFRLVDSDVV